MPTVAELSFSPDQRVFPELETYPLYRVRDEQVALTYHVQKMFWSQRPLAPDHLNFLLDSYSRAMEKPYLAPVTQRLDRISRESASKKSVRVIEIGGATAALLHWWRAQKHRRALHYTGIEPFRPFVEHVRTNFPDVEMIHGDAELFETMSFEGRPPFTAFVAATVFCMIRPEVVRRCIIKAATLTDDLLIRDYLVNMRGEIDAENPILFDYYRRPDAPLMFAHPFQKYFDAIGFEVVHREEARTDVDLPGWGLVHAVRRRP